MAKTDKIKDDKSGRFLVKNYPMPCVITARVTACERVNIARSAELAGMAIGEYVRWCVQLQEYAAAKERVTGADYRAAHEKL